MYPENKMWQDNYILILISKVCKKVSVENGTSSSRGSYFNTIFWRGCIEISHLWQNIIQHLLQSSQSLHPML